MKGGIHTEQKCPVCGSNFRHDENKSGLICPVHPDQRANGKFIVSFGRKVRKRFSNYQMAERFLVGLRYEVDRGTFDARDYLASNPLSFTVLSGKYLEKKKGKIKDSTHLRLVGSFRKMQDYFKNTNVKQVNYPQIDDFIDTLQVSNKTKANYVSSIKGFYTWLLRRREIKQDQYPEFPKINFELKLRNTINKETQIEIINEVKKISYHVSPKIWLGIKWLATYISVRPGEMLNIKEGDIDLRQRIIIIPDPKEKRPKVIPLTNEDTSILSKYPVSLPGIYFFRHGKNVKGVAGGTKFGEKIFYKWWKKACKNLGIENVDMYGGTRHSSAIDLRKKYTPEQIKRSTMHSTSKAFDRYFQISRDELEMMYETTSGKQVENKTKRGRKAK